jgi:DNA-binding NarL/FixJ family response regulator
MDTASRKPTVALAIEHALLRKGLLSLLSREPSLQILGEAATAAETVDLLRADAPDVLVLDLPDSGGAAVRDALQGLRDRVGTVVIATHEDPLRIAQTYDLGARAVLLRGGDSASLVNCIRHVAAGGYWYDRSPVPDADSVKRTLSGRPSGSAGAGRDFGLTRREKEVLAAVVYGQTNRAIARQFSISEQTVKHHLSSIFDKVGVCNRLELALFAVHHRLVEG